jgi:hypothetical protein
MYSVVDALANYPELQFAYLKSIILARDPNYEREREKERERDGVIDSKEMNQPSMAELLERSGRHLYLYPLSHRHIHYYCM